ncbi:MAG: TlpA family protein disulfide reductase [Prevotella sp.]|nr:TlpA family protein disulfide reductase [Prevotella sp.]MBR1556405.1 TlpA family protein disulfide reductase [Prevotella sp.]
MKQLTTLLLCMILSVGTYAQSEQFAVTVKVDSAIASTPQKVYLVSYMESDFHLHDSLTIDPVHHIGTMHGSVPYEYNVNLMFARRGPGTVPLVVKNGDSLTIHIGDEDDGFRFRYINKVEGSPSTLEYNRRSDMSETLRALRIKIRSQFNSYDLSDTRRDSLKKEWDSTEVAKWWERYNYVMTGNSPYSVVDEAENVLSAARHHNIYTESPITMADADKMMNHLMKKFPNYPPLKALANDSTLGNGYTSAASFDFYAMKLRQLSKRFTVQAEDSTLCPLKVGDYMNVYVGYYNLNNYRDKYVLVDFWASWCTPCLIEIPNIKLMAQMFPDDLEVVLVSMDKTSREWWQATKKYDFRSKNAEQTDKPFTLNHLRAYNDKTGEMWPGIKKLGIKTIPHNYLVDRSGRIIAKNISIPMAIDKLKSLIEKEKQQ